MPHCGHICRPDIYKVIFCQTDDDNWLWDEIVSFMVITILYCCITNNPTGPFFRFLSQNSQAAILHVESRASRRRSVADFEFLVKIEATRDSVSNLVKSLQSSSIVIDVAILADQTADEKGDYLILNLTKQSLLY